MKTKRRKYRIDEIEVLRELAFSGDINATYELERFVIATIMKSGKYTLYAVTNTMIKLYEEMQ